MDLQGMMGLMGMAQDIAAKLKNEMGEDEIDAVNNMDKNERSKHALNKVSNILGDLDLGKLMGEDSGPTIEEQNDDIKLTVDVNASDIIKGLNKKVKYKRFVDSKESRERVLLKTEPNTFKKTFVFKGKGDDEGDLIINLKIINTNNVRISNNGDLHLKYFFDKIEYKVESEKIPYLENIHNESVKSIHSVVKGAGLILDDGTKTDVFIEHVKNTDV